MLTHFSLFSGIGGIDLAAERAGFETVGQCEFADYPTKVLEKHWPNVPRWRDIRDVTRESFENRTGLRTVDLVSGGFPCQPFSCAGEQRGEDDDRYLWPEMLRVIRELKPTWVLGENVAGIINMALDKVLSDLEACGYEVQAFAIPAASVDANHKRERVFIVAHAVSLRKLQPQGRIEELRKRSGNSSKDVANTMCIGRSGQGESFNSSNPAQDRDRKTSQPVDVRIGQEWSAEPQLGRVVDGLPNRSHRLKCLGNAVVPQQVYPILKAIAEIELREE